MSLAPLNTAPDVEADAAASRRRRFSDASLANWINENKNSFVRWSSAASSSSITSRKIFFIGAVILLCVIIVISMQMFLHLSTELQVLKFNFGNAHIITRKQAELLENNIHQVENELNQLNKTLGSEFEMLNLELQKLNDAQAANENQAKAAQTKIDEVKADQLRMNEDLHNKIKELDRQVAAEKTKVDGFKENQQQTNADLRNKISQFNIETVHERAKVGRLINGDGRQFYGGILTKVCFIQLFLFYLFFM